MFTSLATQIPHRIVLVGLALMLWVSPTFANNSSNTSELPAVQEMGAIQHELILHLLMGEYEDWATDLDWERIRKFYGEKSFAPVWYTDGELTEKARLWRDRLLKSQDEGLDHTEYHSDGIRYLWRATRDISKARLELLLTDAFFRYSVEVRAGYQYPRAADSEWYIKPPTVKPARLLNEVLIAADFEQALAELPPKHKTYRDLRNALQQYRGFIGQGGDWPRVASGPALRLGMAHPQVVKLRQRLQREGYQLTQVYADPALFDRELEEAVKLFQRNNGQVADGIVGQQTRASLNVSLEDRLEQILHNMERWRWVPSHLGDRYVMVNMAGYRLFVMEDENVVMDMPVIIGKPYKATPAFANEISYLEFNPTWKVPPSIAKENFLPLLKEDSSYLKTRGIRVFESWKPDAKEVDPSEVNWDEVAEEDFKFKLEQNPGDENSLGRIKFMFPNSFRVYLHDTPSRDLFFKNVRTFSSGCIRVARPVSLASYLLGEKNGWSNKQVRDLINAQQTQRVDLPKKVPIYLLYYTAWSGDNGFVQFRNDIYKRNKKIANMDFVGGDKG